jgi:predicted metal-dependent HD superfamily phosphohydrolase
MELIRLCNSRLDDLRNRYSEKHRHYHALHHIGHMLNHFDQVSHLINNPVAVSFAIWYHDAIYDPTRKDNELRSADLFIEHHESYLSIYMQGYVVDLILATITHTLPTLKTFDFNNDCALFLDLDLASLGAPWKDFHQNTNDIRKEYLFVSEEDFNQGRGRILDNFLSRDPLYFSPYFQNYFHDSARRNLKRSVKLLTGKTSNKFPWITI